MWTSNLSFRARLGRLSDNRPIVIAHRGASAYAPENTMPAFELAVRMGANAIELDAMLCAGGDIVVIHDTTVERTTNGQGMVADLSLKEIQQLDAGAWFGAEFEGVHIPSLDDVLDAFGKDILTNIEIKNHSTPFDNLAEKIALCVKRHQLEDRVLFSSFNPLNFRKIKRRLPEAPVGFLSDAGYGRPRLQRLLRWVFPYDALHPHYSDATPQYIKRAHKQNIPVFAYTVDEAETIESLFQTGLDGIITNDPVLALEIAGQY